MELYVLFLFLRGVDRNYTFTSTYYPNSVTRTLQAVVVFTVGIFRTKEHMPLKL
jgi:hypothetical protein